MLPLDKYRSIYEVMPISCVDVLVKNPQGEVLLVHRLNEPAAGQWWFPGGRVCYGERRAEAAIRKLREEVGIIGEAPLELFTEDLLFLEKEVDAPRHGITTVFSFCLTSTEQPRLDAQSGDAQWRTPDIWLLETLHPFVQKVLRSMPFHSAPDNKKNS